MQDGFVFVKVRQLGLKLACQLDQIHNYLFISSNTAKKQKGNEK